MIRLTDDGTLDTVLECSECGEEMRYNFVHSGQDDDFYYEVSSYSRQLRIDNWVKQIIEDETQEHKCHTIED